MANPPAPDVKALATKLAAEWLDTRVAYERNGLAVVLASALTTHTASLREKVEEMERERDAARDSETCATECFVEANAEANRMREAIEWACGERADDRGHWFGEEPNPPKGAFWWRTTLRRMAALSPRPADEPVTLGEI